MLVIFCVFGIVMFPVYAKQITAPEDVHGTTYNNYDFDKFTFSGYLCTLFNFFDILGVITYHGNDQLLNGK